MDKLIKDTLKQYENELEGFFTIWSVIYNDLLNDCDEESTFDLVSCYKTQELLRSVGALFRKNFWEDEVMKSLESIILPPIALKSNDAMYCASSIRNEEEIELKTAFVFAVFKKDTSCFMWMTDIQKQLSCDWYENAEFKQKRLVSGIDRQYANELAIWFRTAFYESQLTYEAGSKIMKTNNLVVFEIEPKQGDKYVLYSLVDLGIEDPNYDDIARQLGIFRISWTMINKK